MQSLLTSLIIYSVAFYTCLCSFFSGVPYIKLIVFGAASGSCTSAHNVMASPDRFVLRSTSQLFGYSFYSDVQNFNFSSEIYFAQQRRAISQGRDRSL